MYGTRKKMNRIKFTFLVRIRLSKQEHRVDALALRAEERRDKLR